jgi:hypothetical protein
MAITHNTGVIATALSRLLAQFQGKPRIEALITAWMTEFQKIEDAFWAVFVGRLLQNNPAGNILDELGGIVGQPRQGFSDAVYALLISARIATNRSDGKRESLISISQLLTPSTPIETREYIGAVVITVLAPITVPPQVLAQQFMERAQLSGVRMTVLWTMEPMANTLLWGYTRGGITDPTSDQSPGYYGAGPSSGFYIRGGLAAGASTADEGSAS